MLREGFFAQACFMSHQVAEKALKALAYYRGDRYVTGHSILDLVSDLESTHPKVSEHRGTASILDTYYVPTRYPNALPGSVPFEVYGRDQAEKAVAAVAKLVGTAAGLIG
jgi:HEPN domain-containing protein